VVTEPATREALTRNDHHLDTMLAPPEEGPQHRFSVCSGTLLRQYAE
jgi:hypothetical protein